MSQNNQVSRKDYKKKKTDKQPEKKGNAGKWIKRTILTLFTLVLVAVIAGGLLFVYYAASAPEMTEDDLLGTFSSELVDKDGEVFYTLGAESRNFANPDEFPEVMINAMTAIEDQRFDSHMGVDPIGIARAAAGFITNRGQISGGGSTITQQLVKLSVFSTAREDQTLQRKAQEAWLAVQLERQLSKEQIMSLYLNKIHMAGNVYGVATASEEYYGKHVSELEIHEAALFAGMAQAPNRFNPYVNPDLAETRRNVVISVMRNEGMISEEEATTAMNTPIDEGLIELSQEERNTLVFDAYLWNAIAEVEDKTGLNPSTAGLVIETNLDMDAQQRVFDVLNSDEYVDFVNEDIQAAVSLVEAETGKVRALGGGRNQQGQREPDRTTQIKPVGSTIKPLTTYGPAIESLQYSTYHQITDEEYSYPDGTPLRNYDREYRGQISLREALVDSRNIPAAKVMNEDLETSQIEEFVENVGLDIEHFSNEGTIVPSNAINASTTPLQLAGSYASFANGGNYTEPYTVSKVITQDGQEIDLTPETNQAMSDYTAYMITDVLKDVAASQYNTVGIANLPQAGKTGTTNFSTDEQDQYGYPSDSVPDSWYVGYTPNYSLSVWTGYDSRAKGYLSFNDGTRQIPRHIYREIMAYVSEGTENSDWSRPSSVTEVAVEDGSNPAQLPGPNTPSSAIVSELFVSGTEPTEVSRSFGEELSAPSGLSADYDEEADELTINWDEYQLDSEDESVSYNLSVNGQSTSLSSTETSITEPPTGSLTITLSVSAFGNTGPESSISITIPERIDEEEEEEEPEEDLEEEPEEEPEEDEEDTEEEPPASEPDPSDDEEEDVPEETPEEEEPEETEEPEEPEEEPDEDEE
ncbi:transglycosylase domain-containing protein [Alkalibacterium olivapovliticus]|uniref:Penicillin-binding protein 1A n=1 Tax=Alkalibacterium olivapovliticus TaxID=99907 RepID=A0A2T0WBT1_9LACT|nr:transglycosylase domain-containing protein [Alkalibacterium olivapovliticus]PRY84161.1 penicillin-binding protein 1A [Alkalibacterium olivapovliticus]